MSGRRVLSKRMRCMFDTTTFNRIVESGLPVGFIMENIEIFATSLQWYEINNTKNQEKRSKLNEVFIEIFSNPTRSIDGSVPRDEILTWIKSKWGDSNWADDGTKPLSWRIKEELDKIEKKKNNVIDAGIGGIAVENNLLLVTDDENLRKIVENIGGKSIRFRELVMRASGMTI